MEGRGPIKNYTREELLRYLQGKMSPAEMHRLEKDALEDPFLADALEGLQEFSSPEPAADFRKLDEQWIAHRKPGVIPMYRQNWFRAAAAILLLVGLGLVANQVFNRQAEPPNGIAQTKEKSVVMDSSEAERMEATGGRGDSVNALASTGASEAPSSSGQPLAIAEPRQPGKSNTGVEPGIRASSGKNSQEMSRQSGTDEKALQESAEARLPPVSNASANKDRAKKEQTENKEIAANQAGATKPSAQPGRESSAARPSAQAARDIPAAPPAPEARRAKRLQPAMSGSQQGPYLYTGQVTDTDNRPLSFVNLRIPNSGLNTYTDARGYYRIMAGDSTILLELKAAGYALRKAELSASRSGEKIRMQPAAGRQKSSEPKASAREEMTKMDEEISKDEDARPEVEPADGWAAYQYYLLNNLRMPADAAQQKLHGTVEVSFLVASDGKRSGYRVEKSLSPSCDREALRLLRDGPAWITYNSEQPLRARVTVVF